MTPVKIGERLSLEYTDSKGEPIGVFDFGYLPVPGIKEEFGGKEHKVKDLILTLLNDRSFVIQSSLTGKKLLWYEIGNDHIAAEDIIVDLELSTES
jgi:hypothetical protein